MGTSRFIYNHYLGLKDKYYNELGINYDISDMKKDVKTLSLDYPWLKDIDSMVSRCTLDDLDRSYTNFFQKRSSHPKFKCKNNHDTYRTNAIRKKYKDKEYCNIKVDLENRLIKLPKLEPIKIRGYRNLKTFDDKKILNATISKEASKYYVSICVEEDAIETPFILKNAVGIDLGVKNLVITSDGIKYNAMNKIDKYERKIKGLNRWLARSKKGSKNREKIKLKLQRVYQKLRNARKYYTHLITKEITDNNDLIAVEDLSINSMIEEASTKTFRKKILDSSMREVLRQIKYKSLWKNKKVIEASRYFKSSQRCNHCGNINSSTKNLSVREWECSKCHSTNDRDINASINILMAMDKKEHLGKDGKIYKQYYVKCDNYYKNKEIRFCTSHCINYFDAEEAILNQIEDYCRNYLKKIKYDKVLENQKGNMKSLANTMNEKILKIKAEIETKEQKKEKIYEDRLNDVIDIEIYKKISNKIDDEITVLKNSLDELETSYNNYLKNHEDNKIDEATKIAKEYLKKRKKPSRELLLQIIDRIEVYEDKSIDLYLKIKPLENAKD